MISKKVCNINIIQNYIIHSHLLVFEHAIPDNNDSSMDMPYNDTDKRNENWLNAVFDDLNIPSPHSKVNFMRMIFT